MSRRSNLQEAERRPLVEYRAAALEVYLRHGLPAMPQREVSALATNLALAHLMRRPRTPAGVVSR